jgi:hypothetical protein
MCFYVINLSNKNIVAVTDADAAEDDDDDDDDDT